MNEQPITVLLIEDDSGDAHLLREAVEEAGTTQMELVHVECLNEGLKCLFKGGIDVVLLYLSLPDGHGLDTVRRIHVAAPAVPIVVVTELDNGTLEVEAIRQGAQDYLVKGQIESHVLVRTIRYAIERNRAEDVLRAAAERWRITFDAISDPVCLIDLEGRILRCNKAMANLVGKSFSEIIGRTCWDLIYGGSVPVEGCPVVRVQETLRRETDVLPVDDRWFNIVVDPLLDDAGHLTGAVHTMTDVTEHKRMEETLRQAEQRYRDLFEEAPVMYVITRDHEGVPLITDCNRVFLNTLGYTRAEVVRRPFTDFYTPESRAKSESGGYQRVLEGSSITEERELLTGDGRVVTILLRAVPEVDAGQVVGTRAMCVDVTERKQLEAQFLQAQKMESIGRLAGGVAHDFNNLLTVILGVTNMAMLSLPEEHPMRHDLQEIRTAAHRAADLTRQLLVFARRQILEPQILDLNELVLNISKMLRRLIGEDIDLVIFPFANLGQVKMDPGCFEQMLVNLVVNAGDAMPDGGILVLETANVVLNETYAQQHLDVTPGEYVLLSVSDTGAGMTEDVKPRCFEPFFTTKEVGKGTGLGLATVYGIVKQSGGHIGVYSEIGQGTTFKIYLPRVKENDDVVQYTETEEIPRGAETVLLVEDEMSVRSVAVRVLEQQGYRVWEAANGEEALKLVMAHPGEQVHLMVTDLVMPQMGGRVLVERLREQYPEVKVLLMSGYMDEVVMRQGVVVPGIGFLQKPFTPEGLARKVREVLDAVVEIPSISPLDVASGGSALGNSPPSVNA